MSFQNIHFFQNRLLVRCVVSFLGFLHVNGYKIWIDVASVPVKQLVAVISGHDPSFFWNRSPELAVERKGIRHVDLRGILPLAINIFDEAVGHSIPCKSFPSWWP